jgi:hypothetical protein
MSITVYKIQFSRTEAFRFRVSPSREALSITPSDSVNALEYAGCVFGFRDPVEPIWCLVRKPTHQTQAR